MHSLQRALVALVLAGTIVPATSVARMQATPRKSGCVKTYTIDMFRNAAITAYRGTRTPTRLDLRHLRKFVRCARHPWVRKIDRRIWRRSIAMNNSRKLAAAGPTHHSWASWYNDSGTHCCGVYAYYGVATCGSYTCYPQGTKIEFFYNGRRVTAEVDDHGPYIGDRQWDLNQNVAGALGFSGVQVVGWRVLK